jgi:hypothetical protein
MQTSWLHRRYALHEHTTDWTRANLAGEALAASRLSDRPWGGYLHKGWGTIARSGGTRCPDSRPDPYSLGMFVVVSHPHLWWF